MRIKELSELTGVRKETIHYYTREELLPKAKKTSSNQSDYGQAHIDRLKLIKSLQESLYMPLSAIKKLIKNNEEKALQTDVVLRNKVEYFNPISQLLDEEVRGEEAFLDIINLSAERLADFEEYEIIVPRIENGEKIYSYNDLTIGRIIGAMRTRGFSADDGFRKDTLNVAKKMLQEIVTMSHDEFFNVYPAKDTENIDKKGREFIDHITVFLNHLFVSLCSKELKKRLNDPEKK
jgi:DNA-binding transcriptional MerR regulator